MTVVPGVVAATASIPVTVPLARIAYKRPESWRFIFSAELLIAPGFVLPGDTYVQVNHNVTTGIGRTIFSSAGLRNINYDTLGPEDAFVKFQWARAGASSFQYGLRKWTTKALSPPLLENLPPLVNPPTTETEVIVGQDIFVETSVAAVMAGGFIPEIKVKVGAFFAPQTHIRPDWYRNVPGKQSDAEGVQFQGNEFAGT